MAKELIARQRLRNNFLWLHRWQGIYFLASLIAASLPVTGFLAWVGRKKKVKKKVAVVAEPLPVTLSPIPANI